MSKSSEGVQGGIRRLVVPVDASGVEERGERAEVKVAVAHGSGGVLSKVVKLDSSGKGQAEFELRGAPAALRVMVGPSDASDEEIQALQTITQTITSRAFTKDALVLKPIAISAHYWLFWLRWCRTFTITGRVVCPDGRPVPGATVCAKDVDFWWWWSSSQQVGCAVTDAHGVFTIKFRWCCGFWPWWWWRTRFWALEPQLVERLKDLLEKQPIPIPPPRPDPQPDLGIFRGLLGEPAAIVDSQPSPDALTTLREPLAAKLPAATSEFAALRLWPWWPWYPWWDCSPDIIFQVTQRCFDVERVIVDETVFNTRWNIPTSLAVTLVARGACCITDDPPPEGNCLVISRVCQSIVDTIGGNPGAPATPAGYLNPGSASVIGDRPFAGSVDIEGLFGSGATVDYYELEWATAPAGPWKVMPPPAAGSVTRVFYGPPLGGGSPKFNVVTFPFAALSGRFVIESREHYEATNDPTSWGVTRFWVSNRDVLMTWMTANNFSDGTYYLRVVGYESVGGNLGEPQILPLCDTDKPNELALTIDNATSNFEPAADIREVRINGVVAGPCSNVRATEGGALEVDFVAYDIDEHLALYSLIATYGKNLAVDLLTVPGATLTPLAAPGIPPADRVGPTYPDALAQGATSPRWRAGGLRLTIPDARKAFPETCCYQLELRVYKRTVVSCNYNLAPDKLSFYSFTVVV